MSNTEHSTAAGGICTANNSETIDALLMSTEAPLDTVCGLLATDPALLLHLLGEESETKTPLHGYSGLRALAIQWLDAHPERWYASLGSLDSSGLGDEQRQSYRLLCFRSAMAAGLIGEWGGEASVENQEDLHAAELYAVLAVFPGLMRLGDPVAVELLTLEQERAAFSESLTQLYGQLRSESYCLTKHAACCAGVAVEIAATVAARGAEQIDAEELKVWSRELQRTPDQLQCDIDTVLESLQQMDTALRAFVPAQQKALLGGQPASCEEGSRCTRCRELAFGNAIATVKSRVQQGEARFGEILDHLMHAVCNTGSLSRAHWLEWDPEAQELHSRRRKCLSEESMLAADDVAVDDRPFLGVLLQKPRVTQFSAEMPDELRGVAASESEAACVEGSLWASVFCGDRLLGVLYADAGQAGFEPHPIGAFELEKFKAIAQLTSKTATLLALRKRMQPEAPGQSPMAIPVSAQFSPSTAANEQDRGVATAAPMRRSKR